MEQNSYPKNINTQLADLEKQFFGDIQAERDPVVFDRIGEILWLYKWRILLLTILGAAIGLVIAFSKVPLYKATVKIAVSPEAYAQENLVKTPYLYYAPKSYFQTQQQIILGEQVLDKVPDKLSSSIQNALLNVKKKRNFEDVVSDTSDRINSIMSSIRFLGSDKGLLEIPTKDENAANQGTRWDVDQKTKSNSEELGDSVSHPQILARLEADIAVTGGETERIVLVSFVSPSAVVAAEVANTVAETYLEHLIEQKSSLSTDAGSWLANQLEESRKKLAQSETALKRYQAEHGLPGLKTVRNISSETIRNINEELFQAQNRVNELAKKYGAKHPSLLAARKNLADARIRADGVADIEQKSRDQIVELENLEAEATANRDLYELYLSRFHEIDLGVNTKAINTMILRHAKVPTNPFLGDHRRNAVMGALISFVVALSLVFLREFQNRTFQTQEQIEEGLKMPVLGVVPLVTKKIGRKHSHDINPERHFAKDPKSNFSEVINHIRTGIIYSNVDSPPHVILVASALPLEGKTTCAANLAYSFSKLGRTLLIDADFRKPRIAKISNIENQAGISGYVAGINTLSECVVEDPENKQLHLMTSGEVPPNPLELLSSIRFKEALEKMRREFEYILIDSAPLLPVSDAIVLGSLADVLLLVIKADSTYDTDVKRALKRLNSAEIRPLGAVLTQVDYKKSRRYGGKYGYPYEVGYYQ